MQIDERVREAHLEHFCPGGVGVPVTSSRPVGLGLEDMAAAAPDGNAARPVGQRCGRCRQLIAARQAARRRVSGTWVHESCPVQVRSGRGLAVAMAPIKANRNMTTNPP
jgi:hypothetical protein